MKKPRLLIVEDEAQLSTMYRDKFEREGFHVRVCPDGLCAAKEVADFLPELVLLDIMMPGHDGFYAIEVIRKFIPDFNGKILVFSNLSDEASKKRAMELGADGYLVKANALPSEVVRVARTLAGIQQ